MKKRFKNTISIVLLVFYLTGFCGLNLLKHSCFVCQEQDYHLIYNLEIDGDEMHVCEADFHHHHLTSSDKESSYASYRSVPCCSLELIYLKNYPKTLLEQVEKSFSASSIDLFICAGLHSHNLIDLAVKQRADYLQKIIDPPEITQDFLCCYRC